MTDLREGDRGGALSGEPERHGDRRPAAAWGGLAAPVAAGAVVAVALALLRALAAAAAGAGPWHLAARREMPALALTLLLPLPAAWLARRAAGAAGEGRRRQLHAAAVVAVAALAGLAATGLGGGGAAAAGDALAGGLVYAATAVADTLRARQRREAHLERELGAMRLRHLRAQLQPHFVFNALHLVSALVEEDPPAAQRTIADLAELLRAAADEHDSEHIPLARELRLLAHYVELQRTFDDGRLDLALDVDEALGAAAVPPFLLQPLVENALRHGRGDGPLRVEVVGRLVRGEARLVVRDDGRGFPRAGLVEGVGLRNTRRRLEHLHGPEASLRAGSAVAGGFEVEVRFPARPRRPAGPG